LKITTLSLPAGVVGQDYLITGMPTTAGPFSVTASVTTGNGVQAGPVTLSLIINPIPQCMIQITTSSMLPGGTAGQPYSAMLNYSPSGPCTGPFTWSPSSLPDNLTLSPAGTITGTPPNAGPFSFTATVQDSAGHSANQTFMFSIMRPPCVVQITTPALLPDDMRDVHFSQQLSYTATGPCIEPFTWTGATVPNGFALSSSGLFSGMTAVPNTYTFTARVQDGAGHSDY
jgi:large repetitive protein